MKKTILIIALLIAASATYAQNYPNVLNYYLNATPTNGVKIKTAMPYTSGSQMPTISITGFNYSTGETISLMLVYYIYNGSFIKYQVSSSGNYAPPVFLAQENSKVVIFLNSKQYFQRFTVSIFATGMSEQASWFTGWTAADEALTDPNAVSVPYASELNGNVTLPGNSIWNSTGNVGIGSLNPDQKLTVNGQVHATSVVVTSTVPADYVFDDKYYLRPLPEVKNYVDKNHHLPDVPAAAEFIKDGQNLGEMNMLLLRKVEELTLYMVEKDKQAKQQQAEINKLKKLVKQLTKTKK